MKHALYFVMGCMLMISITVLQSCEENETQPDGKANLETKWTLGSGGYVKQDGVDVTSKYSGMSLTFFSDGTYTTQNARKMFFPSGTWKWETSDSWTVLIDGDFPVEVQAFNQSQSKSTLLISFHLDADDVNTSGRAEAVVGSYEVLLTKN